MTYDDLLALPREQQRQYWNEDLRDREKNTGFLGEVANSSPGFLARDYGVPASTAAKLRAVAGDLLNTRTS